MLEDCCGAKYDIMIPYSERKLRVDKQQQLEGMCVELEAANSKGSSSRWSNQ